MSLLANTRLINWFIISHVYTEITLGLFPGIVGKCVPRCTIFACYYRKRS